MKRPSSRIVLSSSWLVLLLAAPSPRAQEAGPSPDALRMGSPPVMASGETVETMWPAPTADDWARPCLVPWQRDFDDALRVSLATDQPVLVCVNMDGEPASEHFAGIRYRQEETARFLAPYVCVIASVYRHTPRDYDETGRRIPCPRFGTVTCGEHIALEPLLYERYFEGQRIAPRHIMLERDGSESYDVYYSWDTASVYTAFREGVKDRPARPEVRDDLPLVARVASADAADRAVVERAYLEGTREVRRELLQATLRAREVDQVELLRLALFGLDVELARLARAALARCESESALDLIAEALKVPMAEEERALLLAAAERLAEKFPRGRTLVAVQRGLASPSRWIDVAGWSEGAAAEYRSSARSEELETHAHAAETRPEDGEARLALAESLLARAQDPATAPDFAALLREDARAAANEAEALGARGWRLDAVLAVTSAARGERDAAVARALAAVEGGMPRTDAGDSPLGAQGAVTVLALFAQARQQAIARAYRERKPWPPEWLADIHAAYAVLAEHPLGTDQHVADGYDFLCWLGATPRADEALARGLARFPDSWLLHERLRAQLLHDVGPAGLEEEYTARLAHAEGSPELEWFAAYASLVAAESHRRAGDRALALAAYERALTRYARDRERHPDHGGSIDHYSALALAGRAHILFEQGDLERATREMLAAFGRAPAAAASFDGLGLTPIDSARMLLARLEEAPKPDLAAELQAGLQALGQELLDRPDLQRGVPNEAARAGDRRGRRGAGGG